MSSSSSISSKPPPPHHLLHVDTTTTTNASSSPAFSSPRPGTGGSTNNNNSGGQNQACAACKYQRRKCNPDCPLARYFPADQQRRFLNAHRLFGVSNIQKTLRRIDPEYGPEAMRALIYQSEARAADPVLGCVGVIQRLEHDFNCATAELQALHQQLALFRHHQQPAGSPALVADPAAMPILAAPGQGNGVAMTMDALYGGGGRPDQEHALQAGAEYVVVNNDHQHHADYNNNNALKVVGDDQDDQPPAIPLYDYFCYNGTTAPGGGGDEATSQDATAVDNGYAYSSDAAASVVKQQQASGGSPGMSTLGEQMEQHCQIEAAPFVDAFDVKPHGLQHPMTTTTMEHHGAGMEQQPEDVKVVKYDADQKMAAAAQCHLELGFSSF
ncbi:hypothetical protein QOZ80_6AG0533400 [Eleusine coracana subsp. coracana]|nr:hypothetical protein QOZ80_6AG0533400 [Eleusine coracana subsp. coracana]